MHQYGKAHSQDWATWAEQEMARNPRYTWHREVPHARVRQVYRRTQVLVLPSRMEGGANVISEAIVAGVPVIASAIDGSIGLLGRDYPGYYPLENERALAHMLQRAEADSAFYQQLEQWCIARQSMFTVEQEREGWRRVLAKTGVP